jgi:hypothetical protein
MPQLQRMTNRQLHCRHIKAASAVALLAVSVLQNANASHSTPVVDPDWQRIEGDVRTGISVQVCVEPPLLPESPIRTALFDSLRASKVDYARLQFWYPYPKLSVAELEPPSNGRTHWDFTLLDPIFSGFYAASEGRPIMVNFGTVPQWMYKTSAPVPYPQDANAIDWNYARGTDPRDPTLREIREYYARVASWYVRGGFVDELGQAHESVHHYKIDYWEVLNEIDVEHYLSPRQYTKIYDEVVDAVRQVSPQTKFSGLALTDPSSLTDPAFPHSSPEYFEYFLDRRNHKPNIPLDMISYHFYAGSAKDEPLAALKFTFFQQADSFLSTVRYIEAIRKRLSPTTKTYINEVGSMGASPLSTHELLPAEYWSLSGAVFAHIYLETLKLQIDLVGAAELIDYPGQVAETSLSDWTTGRPNARFQVVRLLHRSVQPGDRLIVTEPAIQPGTPTQRKAYSAQALLAQDGTRKLLIVNKLDRRQVLHVVGSKHALMEYADTSTGSREPQITTLRDDNVTLGPYAVAVVTFTKPPPAAQ